MNKSKKARLTWFDDGDDDDDNHKSSYLHEEDKVHDYDVRLPASNTSENDKLKGKEVMAVEGDEQEDTLDAFMAGIESCAAAVDARQTDTQQDDDDNNETIKNELWMESSTNNTNTSCCKRTRLDECNSDEATAHWVLDMKNNEPPDQKHHIFLDDDDDDPTTIGRNRSFNEKDKKREIILPLSKVHHSSISYEPFRRCFLQQHNSASDFNSNSVPFNDDTHVQLTTLHKNDSRRTITTAASNNNNNKDIIPVMPIDTFEDLNHPCTTIIDPQTTTISPNLFTALQMAGFSLPTPVQRYAMPLLLSGYDLLCTASTGSGKTLAYALPLVVHVCDQRTIVPGKDGPIGLIVSPTRELATQITKVVKALIAPLGGTVISVTGGNRGTYELSQELKTRGCEIVCGTPGRIIGMVQYKNGGIPNLQRVTMVVVDEADKLLSMGFETQVSSILGNVRPDAQRCFVSATFSNRMRKLVCNRWTSTTSSTAASSNGCVHVSVGTTGASSEHVVQHVVVLPNPQAKREWLVSTLPDLMIPDTANTNDDDGRNKKKIIIFVASRVGCEAVAHMLRIHPSNRSITIGSIHGDKHQLHRNETLTAFRKGKSTVLVATDVAARGLDVKDVTTVINLDCAKNMDSHVHRIGRAGRMGGKNNDSKKDNEATSTHVHMQGEAYTLLTCEEADFANSLLASFRREGRPISAELVELAMKSKYSSNNSSLGERVHTNSKRGGRIK